MTPPGGVIPGKELIFNKIIRNLKLSVDDFNTIYLLPFDKKMKIIQLINKLMNP
jgi:hypothetical protein